MSCSNNMKQLGLAIHNYASTYQDNLPDMETGIAGIPAGQYNGSFHFTILPYIEQDSLYKIGLNGSSLAATWAAGNNVGSPTMAAGQYVGTQVIKPYRCPSDKTDASGQPSNVTTFPNVAVKAGTSYLANVQLFGRNPSPNTTTASRGYLSGLKVNTISDGTSNVVGMAEGFMGTTGTTNGRFWAYPSWQQASNGNFGAYFGTFNLSWTATWGNSYQTPQFGVVQTASDPSRAQGNHTGGILVLLMDGSVRLVAASITNASMTGWVNGPTGNPGITTAGTWQKAVIPDDGLVLGSNW